MSTLKAFGAFPEKLVASFCVKILNGLEYLHENSVWMVKGVLEKTTRAYISDSIRSSTVISRPPISLPPRRAMSS